MVWDNDQGTPRQRTANGSADSCHDHHKPDKECERQTHHWKPLGQLSFTACCSAMVSLLYLYRRSASVILDGNGSIAICAMLIIEILTAVPRLLIQHAVFYLCQTGHNAPQRPSIITNDNSLPMVDVFITCCGEGIDVLLDTAKAALAQDYQPGSYRVIVLDDGASSVVADEIEDLRAKQHSNLFYATRNLKIETFAKPGNMNFGFQYTDALPGGSAPLAAYLDVDMIPESEWLRTMVSYVHPNSRVGMASTSQYFYNIPRGDPLGWVSDTSLLTLFQKLQDRKNQAHSLGSGIVVRRSAIDSIGGFPDECMSEDMLSSALLCALGWETIYVPHVLQWGLATDSMADFLRQRDRWTAGTFSVSMYLTSPPKSKYGKGFKRALPSPRYGPVFWGYGIIEASAVIAWTACIFVFSALLLTGKPLLPTSMTHSNASPFLSRLATVDFIAQTLFQYAMSKHLNGSVPLFCQPLAGIWTAPYRLATLVKIYVLPKVLGKASPRFTPTGISGTLGLAEREARKKKKKKKRSGVYECLKIVIWDCGAWMHVLILLSCSVGAIRALCTKEQSVALDKTLGFQTDGLHQVVFPPFLFIWAALIKNAWTPLSYALWPPPVRHREDLLDRNESSGVAHPKNWVKKQHHEPSSEKFWWIMTASYSALWVMYEMIAVH